MYRCVPIVAITLALLAPGCCLPRLSGRYDKAHDSPCDEPAGLDEKAPTKDATVEADARPGLQPRDRLALHGRPMRPRRWPWSRRDAPGTPPGEVVPLPRFHPVPVRPVFEPQFDYAPPQLLLPYLPPPDLAAPADGEPTPAAPPAAAPPAAAVPEAAAS